MQGRQVRTSAPNNHDDYVERRHICVVPVVDRKLAYILRIIRRQLGELLLELQRYCDAAIVLYARVRGQASAFRGVYCILDFRRGREAGSVRGCIGR